MKNYILIALIGLISTFYSCSQENKTIKNKVYNAQIEYPYSAPEQRQNIIFDNMNKLKFGMDKKEVVQLLTLPDEINATYPSNVTAKDTIGFSYVYIIERKQENGSQNEKAEKLIRIHFDTNEKLVNTYAIRIPEFNQIEKEATNTDNNLPGSKFSIEEAVKKSMIIPISETKEIKYHKPIIAKCIAVENPVEPGQIIVTTCYYYQKFNVTETISGNIDEIFEADYITYVPVNEENIKINSSHILFLQESKAEGKYHLIKVIYDTENNRQEIKSSIEKLSDLINFYSQNTQNNVSPDSILVNSQVEFFIYDGPYGEKENIKKPAVKFILKIENKGTKSIPDLDVTNRSKYVNLYINDSIQNPVSLYNGREVSGDHLIKKDNTDTYIWWFFEDMAYSEVFTVQWQYMELVSKKIKINMTKKIAEYIK